MKELRNDYYDVSVILSRVLNSGVIMSIEKNDKEIPGLEKNLKKITGKKYASVFNSYQGALHGVAISYTTGYGDILNINNPNEEEIRFLKWIGIDTQNNNSKFERYFIDFNSLEQINNKELHKYETIIFDFKELKFGSAAVIVTDNQELYDIAEKLKIFGAYDLRTMWTQKRDESSIEPGIQFNYRLSPLVAACIKMSILRGGL